MALLLAAIANPARADCPAAPIADSNDMAISFLAANGVQAASASLLSSSVKEGTLIYDDTADKLKVCDGTNWIDVGSGSGTDTLASLSCAFGEIAKYNGTAWACAADGGGASNPVAFSVQKNGTGQTVTSGSWTKLTWSTEDYDTNSNFASDRFTATVAGKYLFTVAAECTAATASCLVGLHKNGTAVFWGMDRGADSAADVTGVLDLAPGDYVEAFILHNTGTSVNGDRRRTYFQGNLLGGGADTLSGLSCASGEIAKWNGSAWACAADGGGGAGTSAPGPYLRLSYSANALDRLNVIPFNVAESGGGATWAANKFTATIPGLYLTTVEGFALGANYIGFSIRKNGSTLASGYGDATQTTKSGGSGVTAVTYLNAGDYIDFWYTHDSPGIFLNTATASVAFVGGGGSGNTVAFSVHKNGTNQTVTTSSWVPLSWSTEAFDTNNNFDTGTGRFTPTVAGKYLVTAQVQCSGATTLCAAAVYKNGSVASENVIPAVGSQEAQAVVLLEMNGSTDYVEAYAHNGGGTVIIGAAANTNFQGFLIGGGSDTLSGLSCASGEIPKWNGSAWACAADGGGGTASQYGFSASKSTSGTFTTATYNILTGWTETDDVGGVFNPTSGVFTAPVAGMYVFTGLNHMTTTAANYFAYLAVNGSVARYGSRFSNSGSGSAGTPMTNVSSVMYLDAGDQITFGLYSDVNGTSQFASFSGAYLGGSSDTLSGLSCLNGEIPKWNGTAWACAADGGGGGGSGVVPSFHVHKGGTNQSVTSDVWTPLTWSTEAFDTNSNFDTGTGRFTPTVAGKYYFSLNTFCTNATTFCAAAIYKNGSVALQTNQIGAGAFGVVNGVIDMNGTTDYVTAYGYAAGGNYINGTAAYTNFSGSLLGGGSDTLSGLSCATNEIPKWSGSAWACAADGGGVASDSSMVAGWPDAITCNITSPAWGQRYFYLHYDAGTSMLYRMDEEASGGNVGVWFTKSTKTFANYDTNLNTAAGGAAVSDCSGKTIDQLYASGHAFNFVGGGASGGSNNSVAFSVRKTANQAVTATTWTKVAWEAEDFDTNNNFDLTTERFTPTKAGKYQINLTVYSQDVAGYLHAVIYKNGAYYAGNVGSGTTTNRGTGFSTVVDMNGSTDYIEAYAYLYGSGTVNIYGATNNWTNFSGFLIGGGGGSATAAGSVAGAVQFNDGSDAFAADDVNLVWDNTNKRLGIGTATPGSMLHVLGTSASGKISITAPLTGNALIAMQSKGTDGTINTPGNKGWNLNVRGDQHANTPMQNAFSFDYFDGTTGYNYFSIMPNGAVGMGALPAASALMDLTSTTKGFLPPRMTTAQRDAIASPATGLVVYDTDLNSLYIRTASGWGAVGSSNGTPVAFIVSKNANQSIASGSTDLVTWPTEEYDPANSFASNRFTAPVAGLYSVSAQLTFTSTSTWGMLWIYKNGAPYRVGLQRTSDPYPMINALVNMNAGDYLEVWTSPNGGTPAVYGVATYYSYFQGFLVNGGGGSSQWTTTGNDIYYGTGNVGIGTTGAPSPYALGGTPRILEIQNPGTTLHSQADVMLSTGVNLANSWIGVVGASALNSSAGVKSVAYMGMRTGPNYTTANPTGMVEFATRGAADSTWTGRVFITETGTLSVGNATPNDSAILQADSTTKGFLPPRMTGVQRDAIASPAEGLVVYNTTTKSLDLRVASSWLSFGGSMTGNTMVSGWPDAIKCTITNPNWGVVPFYPVHAPDSGGNYYYRVNMETGTPYSIAFSPSGAFAAYQNLTTTDCNTSISALYAAGKAFNFVGGATASADGTAGQVQFNEGGNLKADAALHWDNTNKRLGIGTSSPLGPLHVALGLADAGSARFYAPLASDGQFSQLRLGYGDGSFQSLGLRFIRYASGNELALFHWGESYGIHLKQGGNVGIGTATPAQKLDVDGNAEIRNGMVGGRNNSQNNFHIDAYNGSGTRGIFLNYGTGTSVYLAGGVLVTSDARKKKDVETLEGALEKIGQLRGVSYRWIDKEKDQTAQFGVIAQEVRSVYPELVRDDSYGFLTVNYEGLIAPLIEAVKELKADNDNLRAELKAANDNYEELRNDLDALKASLGANAANGGR
ncbi:C1q-like domain-containing protein [Bradyrhizobium liaoningense]